MELLILMNSAPAANLDAGDIVECRASDAPFTTVEAQTFCLLKTTDPMSSGLQWANIPYIKQIGVTVNNALTSNKFWRMQPAQYALLKFNQVSYDQATQTHVISCDYSAVAGMNPTYVETMVTGHGCSIVSHANRVITFSVSSPSVQAKFIADIQANGATLVRRFRYSINATLLAQAIAAGTLVTDLATITAAIIDKSV